MMKKTLLAMAMVAGLSTSFAHAQIERVSATPEQTKAAQEKLRATFSQINVTNFQPSPVPGVFELSTGGNTFYYYPGSGKENGVLIFGEMYDSKGNNLTQQARENRLADAMKTLPLDKAITIGPKDAKVDYYEITDPECPYCDAYHEWFVKQPWAGQVRRHLVFLMNGGHPGERREVEHIICSKDQDKALNDAFANTTENTVITKWATCKESAEIIAAHDLIVKAAGAQGTPAFIFQGKLVTGFDEARIQEAITKLLPPQEKE